MYDVSGELSILSQVLKNRDTTILKAGQEIRRTIRILSSFKERSGEETAEVSEIINREANFHNVPIQKSQKENINQNQLLQSLIELFLSS